MLLGLSLAFTVLLAAGVPVAVAGPAGLGLLAVLALGAGWDLWRSLRLFARSGPRVERWLPAGLRHHESTELRVDLVNEGPLSWTLKVFDGPGPALRF